MKVPDWLFYVLVLLALWGAFGRESEAPPSADWMPDQLPPASEGLGEPADTASPAGMMAPDLPGDTLASPTALPEPSPFDDGSYVIAEAVTPGSTGTAFTVGPGLWLTARHVVRGCPNIVLANEQMEQLAVASIQSVSDRADVAVLVTGDGPRPLALDVDEADLVPGAEGFHAGYPQGEPGEAVSRLIGRERMVTKGAWRGRENTLAWAETGRTRGLDGSLGGMSGGPVFDARGKVLGITIAESPRRGRIITTAADSVIEDLAPVLDRVAGAPLAPLEPRAWTRDASGLRDSNRVVRVICLPPR